MFVEQLIILAAAHTLLGRDIYLLHLGTLSHLIGSLGLQIIFLYIAHTL